MRAGLQGSVRLMGRTRHPPRKDRPATPPAPERVSALPCLPSPAMHPAPAGQAPGPGGRSAHALGRGSSDPSPRPPHRTSQCPSPGPQILPPWELRWHPHLQARAARPSDFCPEWPRVPLWVLSSGAPHRNRGGPRGWQCLQKRWRPAG